MSESINIHEAKTHLSKLLERVAGGEELVIAKAGKPMAKLVPYVEEGKARVPGVLAGQVFEEAGCWESDEEALDGYDELLEESISKVAEAGAEFRAKS
ncbi:MAG: type II toxin-antitoxin system Phd/YefM family antitoxin [Verrucomicrobiales bacterium]